MVGKRIPIFSLLLLLALALALIASGDSHAQSYKPLTSYSLTDTTPGAASDSVTSFSIPAPDYNHEDSSMWTLTPIDLHAVTGDQLPIGAGVGVLSWSSTVGLFGGPCSTALPPSFSLYNATVDNADELPPWELYWVFHDILLAVPYDRDNPQLPDYLEAYPHFLNDAFDPPHPDVGPQPDPPPLKPRARYAGHAPVASMNFLIQLLVFDPGQVQQMGGVYAQFDSAMGTPTVVILNNPINLDATPGAISDFCTPLEATVTIYGTTTDNPLTTGVDESGYAIQNNPPAGAGVMSTGTLIARNYSRSERDADGDGYENDFDPCPYTADPGWDQRLGGNQPGLDTDGDGLADSCDPDINGNPGDPDLIDCTGTQTDCDRDGYDNRQDNCPLVPNGCTVPECSDAFPPMHDPNWDNQADRESALSPNANADMGPNPDSIGDACDDSDDDGLEAGGGTTPGSGNCDDGIDNDADNKIDGNDPECVDYMDKGEIALGHTHWQIWGTNPGNGQFYHAMSWAAACVGATDTDGDGYCDDLETALGSPTDNGAESGTDCDNATDDDGDGYVNDGCPIDGIYIERGAECANATDDDTGDGGDNVNDGCPVIGVPESLVIDTGITLGAAALPSAAVPESCSDGVDNDGDTLLDAADNSDLGCDPSDDSYATDPDYDGNNDDNCPSNWNPEQVNTEIGLVAGGAYPVEIDAQGDVCDVDDDNDLYNDSIEWWIGTDPLDNCPNVVGKHDAWPPDIDMSRDISVTGDLFKYIGKIGCRAADGGLCRRLDLDGTGDVSVTGDVFGFIFKIGQYCK